MSTQDTGADATISDDVQLDTLREGIDDPVVLRDQLRKEAEARRQLTARAKRAEEDARSWKEKAISLEPESKLTNEPPVASNITINDEVVDLRLDGYSKKEVEWIMKNGGSKVLSDPNSLVSLAIKAQREQLKAEQASSQVADTAGQSEIERKYTPQQLAAMSVKELEAILPHA